MNLKQNILEHSIHNGCRCNASDINRSLFLVNALANPGQDVVDIATNKYVDSFTGYGDMIRPLVDYFHEKTTLESAKDGLLNQVGRMNATCFESDLLKLRFASEIIGRICVNRENRSSRIKAVFPQFINKNPRDLFSQLSLCFDKSPEDAVQFLESMGIKLSFDWETTAKLIAEHDFSISGISKAEILQMFKDELTNAIDTGEVYSKWKSNLENTLQQAGYLPTKDYPASRLELIYRMNTQTALMRGRYLQQKSVTDTFPYWTFAATVDSRTTVGCLDLNNTTLPANAVFWQTNYPLRHFLCRSVVRSVSASEAATDKYTILTDDDTIEINGVKTKIGDIKPAKGFDFTPDKMWKPDYSNIDPDIQKALNVKSIDRF